MLTKYLFVVGFGLVAANPILQRIPIKLPVQSFQSQPCPSQTCPTKTCPSQTCPTQTRSTPQPCQTCQTPYRNVYSPPSNNCPCNKQAQIAQSALTAQSPQTAQVNPVTNLINQDVLTQLVLRRLFSPPQQAQANPAAASNNCEAQKAPPNIINNYIIIPPEYFKTNETKVNKEGDTKTESKRRRKQSKRRNQEIACSCEDKDKIIVEKLEISCPCDKDTSVVGEPVTKGKIVDDSALKTNVSPKGTITSQNHKRITNYNEVVIEPALKDVDTKKSRKGNRGRKNSLEEAIIKDFCRKHPNVPEEIARSLMKKLKQQFDKRSKPQVVPYPFRPYDYDYYEPALSYPRIYDHPRPYNDVAESDRSRKRKQHRSGRRHKKLKEEVKKNPNLCDKECEKLVEQNPKVINIETETITTEKITASTEKLKENLTVNNSETQMENPDDLLEQLDKMKAKFAKLNEIETTTVSYNKRIEQYPELGKEDKVPTVYDNGVDDYYPDFREDNILFYGSDEEYDSKEDVYDNNGELNSKR
ncbi:uncharacterized protein LOC125238842 isoform X2 [Leguminivora glycinivorella]|nr:uncharacterized protein LOC125238842 isoform X2 [Leguminivora glycinivorella]